MTGIPTLKEELDRKTFDAIEWLFTAVDKKRITPSQFSTGIDALFMAVSGLTDDSILELVSAGSAIAAKEAPVIKRHFVKDDVVISFSWCAGEENWSFVKRKGGKRIGGGDRNADTPAEAYEAMNEYAEQVLRTGFTEI